MNPETPERFVDADEAATFLSLTRRRVLDLVRARKLPGHPIGDGSRRVWRFRLSELATAMTAIENTTFTSRERTSMFRGKAVPGRVAD